MSVPIKEWTSGVEVENEARKQLEATASLPIVGPWLAVMPDVHWGMGSTVGSVVPTRGAVIPACVGVDLGCFAGETLVPLADGKLHRIDSLPGHALTVWAASSDRIVAAHATASMTRSSAPLVRVTLDNGESVRCTPDHRFMMRDGVFVEAKDLAPGASLMPFYSRVDPEGYVRISQPHSGGWQRAHWIVARSGLLGPVPRFVGQRTIIHHRNFTESDNSPENLQFMGDRDHSTYHRSLVDRNTHWQSPAFEECRVLALRDKAATDEGLAYFAARGTKNILRYMADRPDHFKMAVAGNGVRGRATLIAYNRSEEGRKKSAEVAARVYTCPCGASGRSGFFVKNHINRCQASAPAPYNHKVVIVETLPEMESVYCLTVPGLENFALGCGVFVHNCGMNAVRTNLTSKELGDNGQAIRDAIEKKVPHGRTDNGGPNDRGAWHDPPIAIDMTWERLATKLAILNERTPGLDSRGQGRRQLGTLGTGNHFVEVCLDEQDRVWIMLHSGSRGIGNRIGSTFIAAAKKRCEKDGVQLPNSDLAWLPEGAPEFDAYVEAVAWAQDYAWWNRQMMVHNVKGALWEMFPFFLTEGQVVSCHHNYVNRETHFGEDLWITRKGAVSAKLGEMGIIPGAMGKKSYIVKGKGNLDSFHTCSHGAGRVMSRGEAKKTITLEQHAKDTEGVFCRKDASVLDESPRAYKSIDAVMAAQSDLVEIVHTLRAVVCVKG